MLVSFTFFKMFQVWKDCWRRALLSTWHFAKRHIFTEDKGSKLAERMGAN